VGAYSEETEAAQRLHHNFGVPILADYRDAVGRIDGLVITARHGANHYKYAKPYLASGIPMFIDKPITICEAEAVAFMRELRDKGIPITGGSSLKHAEGICTLKQLAHDLQGGKTIGGTVRAPLASDSVYGGFYFYAQHLVEMVCEVFGRYPRSVLACSAGSTTHVLFRYDGYDVHGLYSEHTDPYYAVRHTQTECQGGVIALGDAFFREFDEFYKLLNGETQRISYEDFISPVFIMNAIQRALASGREEKVREYKL